MDRGSKSSREPPLAASRIVSDGVCRSRRHSGAKTARWMQKAVLQQAGNKSLLGRFVEFSNPMGAYCRADWTNNCHCGHRCRYQRFDKSGIEPQGRTDEEGPAMSTFFSVSCRAPVHDGSVQPEENRKLSLLFCGDLSEGLTHLSEPLSKSFDR
jgi:hypothetical protein